MRLRYACRFMHELISPPQVKRLLSVCLEGTPFAARVHLQWADGGPLGWNVLGSLAKREQWRGSTEYAEQKGSDAFRW
jgi:hypothetical protein